MKNSGKLLKISDERSIYILEDEDGNYINQDLQIRYRNIGPSFEKAIINECQVKINTEKGLVEVLDAVGNPKFHFPMIWLDTDQMKIISLIDKGLLSYGK